MVITLLAYCIVLGQGQTDFPPDGVLGSRLEPVDDSGLIALCSEMERSSISAKNFQRAALEFHRVTQAVFARRAVVPFRFPTWLSSEEMRAHLSQESLRYKDFLLNHADNVQMEVRIVSKETAMQERTTGGEHLRARAAQLRKVDNQANEIKNLAGDNALEWREQETPDGVRLYALVSRTSIEKFREKLKLASVPVTGPWPATAFFNQLREED